MSAAEQEVVNQIGGDQEEANTGGNEVNSAVSVDEKINTLAEVFDRIVELQSERSSVNADIQAERERVEALGIQKKAMDMAMAYVKMDEKQRAGFDTAYAMARKALGCPIQDDMFGFEDQMADSSE